MRKRAVKTKAAHDAASTGQGQGLSVGTASVSSEPAGDPGERKDISPHKYSSESHDDGFSALQLPFSQTSEMTKFLNSSKEWMSENRPDSDLLDEIDELPAGFFGHYSAASMDPSQILAGHHISHNPTIPGDYRHFHSPGPSHGHGGHGSGSQENSKVYRGHESMDTGVNMGLAHGQANVDSNSHANVNPGNLLYSSEYPSSYDTPGMAGGSLLGASMMSPDYLGETSNNLHQQHHAHQDLTSNKSSGGPQRKSTNDRSFDKPPSSAGTPFSYVASPFSTFPFTSQQQQHQNDSENETQQRHTQQHQMLYHQQHSLPSAHAGSGSGSGAGSSNPAADQNSHDTLHHNDGPTTSMQALSSMQNYYNGYDSRLSPAPLSTTPAGVGSGSGSGLTPGMPWNSNSPLPSTYMSSGKFNVFSPDVTAGGSSPYIFGQMGLPVPSPLTNGDFSLSQTNMPSTSGDNFNKHGLAATADQLSSHIPSGQAGKDVNVNSVLSFLPAIQETLIYDHRGEQTNLNLQATLAGSFFLGEITPAEDKNNSEKADPVDNDDVNDSSAVKIKTETDDKNTNSAISPDDSHDSKSKDTVPYELTFYRRNLFQVTATVSNAHKAVYAANSENPSLRSQILSLSLSVTVLGSDDKTPKTLMYCPPKSSHNSEKDSENKSKADLGPPVKFIYPTDSEYDDVVSWKRLQFRTATSHNGHRKSQHYFSVCVSVYAELENTQRVRLMSAYSRPIVVRGRNPRFYQNRNNIIISELMKRPVEMAQILGVAFGSDKYPEYIARHAPRDASVSFINETSIRFTNAGSNQTNVPDSTQAYNKSQSQVQNQNQNQNQNQKQGQSKSQKQTQGQKQPQSDTFALPKSVKISNTSRSKSTSSSSSTKGSAGPAAAQMPSTKQRTSSFMTDEEDSEDDGVAHLMDAATWNNRRLSDESETGKGSETATAADKDNRRDSMNKNKELDYEYFPLPINYWLPPVEVVYRPHAVHHPMAMPPSKPRSLLDNTKRYFSSVE